MENPSDKALDKEQIIVMLIKQNDKLYELVKQTTDVLRRVLEHLGR